MFLLKLPWNFILTIEAQSEFVNNTRSLFHAVLRYSSSNRGTRRNCHVLIFVFFQSCNKMQSQDPRSRSHAIIHENMDFHNFCLTSWG
mmetsp:Transcript_81183/g.159334  ORF Transcript_81183/g.159334 Transcript_81183/m.159334 type:complete len:88 (+) Transcript_81183:76-339(+)